MIKMVEETVHTLYEVVHPQMDDIPLITLRQKRIENGVTIAPTMGACMVDLKLAGRQDSIPVIDAYVDAVALRTCSGYRSAKLLPFPNRITDGNYLFKGREYQLPINRVKEGHAIHGLVYDRPFKVSGIRLLESRATTTLEYVYEGDIDGYPFPYKTEIVYTLESNSLAAKSTVTNTGRTVMPLGDGWHPYFKLSGPADDWLLELPPRYKLELNTRNVPTGSQRVDERFRKLDRIGTTAFDDAFALDGSEAEAVTKIHDRRIGYGLEITQECSSGQYQFLQVYIPKTRDSIAIEPMSCAPDAFNNGMGLIALEPGESYQAKWNVKLIDL